MGGEHRCPVCEATFTRPQHVARHMRSHTGDRPYRCQFCPDQFARSDLLSRHVNKCHEAEKPPAGPPGRKASKAALRATCSKQTCDQCVKASLSCDGAKPCARCTQRKIPCTFVQFNRQTAPTGPGHEHNASTPASALVSSPFSTTALSNSSLYETADDTQHAQHQFYSDWSQTFYHNASADHDFQQYRHRRGSLDYAGSLASASISSSASSSSSHLPIEANPMHQSFQFNTSFDNFHQQPNPSSDDSQVPFNSAFGVLSIHDPDAVPFFSQLQQHSEAETGASAFILSNMVGTGMTGDPNATPMARDDVNWLINASSAANLSHTTATPTGFQPRRRATSMFNVRTPTAVPEAFLQSQPTSQRLQAHHDHRQLSQQQAIYGVLHPIHAPVPVQDLSSWSAKIQSQRLPELSITAAKVKARRQTLAGGERESSSQSLRSVPAPSLAFRSGGDAQALGGQATSLVAFRDSASPADPYTRSSSSSTTTWENIGPEAGMRPAFKRLPSATPLEHGREHKRVLISYPLDNGAGPGSGGCAGSKIEDASMALFDRNREPDRVLYSDVISAGSGSVEVGEHLVTEMGRSTAGPGPGIRSMMNMAERRVSVAEGDDILFGLQPGTL